jgi:hypothetical protein
VGHAIRSQHEGHEAHHRPVQPTTAAHGGEGRRTPTSADDDDKYKKWGTIN